VETLKHFQVLSASLVFTLALALVLVLVLVLMLVLVLVLILALLVSALMELVGPRTWMQLQVSEKQKKGPEGRGRKVNRRAVVRTTQGLDPRTRARIQAPPTCRRKVVTMTSLLVSEHTFHQPLQNYPSQKMSQWCQKKASLRRQKPRVILTCP